MLNRATRQYFKAHDIPCPECDYNLRGLRQPKCPECGSRLKFGSLDELSQGLESSIRVEHIEYGMYKQLSAALSITMLACAVLFVLSQTHHEIMVRISIASGIFVLSGLNMLARHRYYRSSQSILAYEQRHIDRIRDAYGAFSMIMLIMFIGIVVMMAAGMM